LLVMLAAEVLVVVLMALVVAFMTVSLLARGCKAARVEVASSGSAMVAAYGSSKQRTPQSHQYSEYTDGN
jgi:hypothetical protein